MRLIVLASGSSGNAALIESGGRAVLLDAGISARETLCRIDAAGAGDARIEAILLTHEHSDHVRGARVLARRLGVPVLATKGTLDAAARCLDDVPATEAVPRSGRISVAGMRITSFATAHDAAESCGYAFESRSGHRVAIVTDTGVLTTEAKEALAGAHMVGIETNHDLRMLRDGPYPPFLKARIAGDRGHLSNESAAAALADIAWSGLTNVFGLHISEQNNTVAMARQALATTLGKRADVTFEAVARGDIMGCAL